jgi:hypothetical protein
MRLATSWGEKPQGEYIVKEFINLKKYEVVSLVGF